VLITTRHGPRRKHIFYCSAIVAKHGMTYYNVASSAIGTECAENTIPLFFFAGSCLVTAGCCDHNSCFEQKCHNTNNDLTTNKLLPIIIKQKSGTVLTKYLAMKPRDGLFPCTQKLDTVTTRYFLFKGDSPYGREIQARPTDRMNYQRHVGRLLELV
jgi:hypothetical protein